MPRPRLHARPQIAVPVNDTDPFTPDTVRPVRLRARSLPADTHFEPHQHPWAQLAYCASGIVQVTAAAPGEVTYIVPPSRAVWIAPGARHAVHVLEAAEFRTLYIDASATPAGWSGCRVIVVSALLRELIAALDLRVDGPSTATREAYLSALVLDEIRCASTQALGVPMPHPEHADKRLRALCEAMVTAPTAHATLAAWSAAVGASERTMARLFRQGLGVGFQPWRQQVLLAHALPLLARGLSVSQVAAASGYASDSAFTVMFKTAMGQPPSSFRPS